MTSQLLSAGVSAWSWAFTVSGRLNTRDPVSDNVCALERGPVDKNEHVQAKREHFYARFKCMVVNSWHGVRCFRRLWWVLC